jgi:hypothetical protein
MIISQFQMKGIEKLFRSGKLSKDDYDRIILGKDPDPRETILSCLAGEHGEAGFNAAWRLINLKQGWYPNLAETTARELANVSDYCGPAYELLKAARTFE